LDFELEIASRAEELKAVLMNAHAFWDYAPFFPVLAESKVTMGEGNTALIAAQRLQEKLGVRRLFLKNETANPTGSFKDRCMSLSFTKALELGAPAVALGSAGNAGASAAAYAARAQVPCFVLIPESTPLERVALIAMLGAQIILVRGSTTDCIELVEEACKVYGWHNVTTASAYNPFQAEATTTIAFELARALDWSVPDWILVPIGGGGILSGIYKGYRVLHTLGLVDRVPRMVGVQAAGCAPVVQAFQEGRAPDEIERWGSPTGVAVAIADPYPMDGCTALQAIYQSRGYSESVSDGEILKAQSLLANCEGVCAEPASATTVAALAKLLQKGVIKPTEEAVCIITGTGMKELQLIRGKVGHPPVIEKNAEDLSKAVEQSRGRL
jgi:threonine synthase